MVKTFHHIFYQKKPKNYQNGPVPIYLRITVEGKRAEVSINREVEPGNWISKAGRLKGKSEEVKKFNAHLDALQSKLYDAHQALIRENKPITAETLKNRYIGAGERQRTIIPIFKKHNDEMQALIPQEYAEGTLERFRITLSHLKEFLLWKYKTTDVELRQINHEFVADFDFYIRSERKCANNTAVKYSKYFQKIIRICIANGWIEKDPFVNFKVKLKVVDRAFLSEEELQAIQTKEFTSIRLNQVRDVFLFSCFTGLAYADVLKLSPGHVSTGIDGEKWLFVNRTKTDTPSRVPLLPVALEIIEKYSAYPACINQNKLLPVSSNQKMNAYLKEIADVCNITKELTFHIARHTFATTVTLNNDVPIESVSKMLGHKTIKTTQHYAKLLDKKVSSDMNALRNKFTRKEETADLKTGS
ncbi:site-specific integrase [Lacibacter luteus]|uniref:Site-specific integrase n=1 Tax=Lacibacter luteus TaxID=2508719 RepID=A0A4Q1CH00_9BACT|nr:site-specific integrase [Lacibacter luteus]RXK59176.1 site-specific integrase [Lacibacter luteus]